MIQYNAIYTFEEAMEVLRVDKYNLWNLIEGNQLKFVLIDGHRRIRGTDLEQYVDHLTSL